MSTHFSPQIDPSDVLGVARDASLEQIRDAYRTKAKRYHPDAGGEDWAFRILVQAYEVMSTARVVRASQREAEAAPRWRPQPQPQPQHQPGPRPRPEPSHERFEPRPQADAGETVRPGVQEQSVDPARVVEVEKLTLRHEVDHVWLVTEHNAHDRQLSCSLNITWPASDVTAEPSGIGGAAETLVKLGEVFEALRTQTHAQPANASVTDGRFSGWLSYAGGEPALAAFGRLRTLLHEAGLVVRQTSRDVVIPRPGRRPR